MQVLLIAEAIEILKENPTENLALLQVGSEGGQRSAQRTPACSTVGLNEIIWGASGPSYFFLGGNTASLKVFAKRNFTTVVTGILMASPV